MRAIRIAAHGGPEVMHAETIDTPEPGPGEALVRIAAAGVNFIDTYHRKGMYPLELPTGIGVEAAGVVEAVGEGVDAVAVGDRVAYVMVVGSYADHVVIAADRLVPVPDGVGLELAAAVLLQGLTGHFLVNSTFELGAGDTALVLAAAGGVGHLLMQMTKAKGARAIAVTSSEEKVALIRQDGAEDVIVDRGGSFAPDVRELTEGRGVDVVYDGVGQATFDASLDCLRPRGMMVLYGAASGPVPPLDPQVLNTKGSLFLTRPTLTHYASDPEERRNRAASVFSQVQNGSLAVRVDATFPLEDAASAHRYIEAGKTKGKLLLLPD